MDRPAQISILIWFFLVNLLYKVSQREKTKYCMLIHIYMESRKIVPANLLQSRNRDADIEDVLVDAAGKGEGGTNRESSIDIYTPPKHWCF